MHDHDEELDETAGDNPLSVLDSFKRFKNPEARAAAAIGYWQRFRTADGSERRELLNHLTDVILEKAWDNPRTRRMTLVMLRATLGWERRELAKLLGVSIVAYNYVELGRQPLSRESLAKIATAKEVTERRLHEVLLIAHAMVTELDTGWEMLWQERLAPLSAQKRREEILADKDLHNWGLGKLICTKCREAEDPHEAVALAELALLVAEHLRQTKPFRQRFQAYAWGHLGHALQRRGNRAAAEAAFAECIELWTTAGPGFEKDDKVLSELLASIVPGFPPYQPPPRKPARRKPAKRKRTRSPRMP